MENVAKLVWLPAVVKKPKHILRGDAMPLFLFPGKLVEIADLGDRVMMKVGRGSVDVTGVREIFEVSRVMEAVGS